MTATCGMCGRLLGQADDPLSNDCGGDCWGCISEVEAEGMDVDLEAYRRDPASFFENAVEQALAGPPASRPWWEFWR